ncbi:MAG: YeeE/YedE family protein [Silicimonas sp.]|nr:YeeE/YedE family protein [Silicimonas sp.]
MLYDLFDTEITPLFASVLLGIGLGALFGAAAQISRFCLRRGVVEGPERSQAAGVWLTALIVAVLGTQLTVWRGGLDFSEHRFFVSEIPALAIAVGGLLFGAGMVLTRGCVSRLTVLSATGNLRAATVLVVFSIVAHATLKGLLAPIRVSAGSVTVDTGVVSLADLPGGAPLWTAAIVVGLGAIVWRSGARPLHLALAAVIGALVPLGWFGTGIFLFDDFDPIALNSLSFTAPWADTLFWSVASSAVPAGFGVGLVGGVLVGSFLSAAARGELELQSFDAPRQTLRYVSGAGLMGFGGVLAGGCTVGAGLSGVPTLSFAAVLALLAIIVGARITDRVLDRAPSGAAVPAE